MSVGAFGLYAAIAGLFWMFFYAYLPETRGVPLEDAPSLFRDRFWGKAWATMGNKGTTPTGVCGWFLRIYQAGSDGSIAQGKTSSGAQYEDIRGLSESFGLSVRFFW